MTFRKACALSAGVESRMRTDGAFGHEGISVKSLLANKFLKVRNWKAAPDDLANQDSLTEAGAGQYTHLENVHGRILLGRPGASIHANRQRPVARLPPTQ